MDHGHEGLRARLVAVPRPKALDRVEARHRFPCDHRPIGTLPEEIQLHLHRGRDYQIAADGPSDLREQWRLLTPRARLGTPLVQRPRATVGLREREEDVINEPTSRGFVVRMSTQQVPDRGTTGRRVYQRNVADHLLGRHAALLAACDGHRRAKDRSA